MENLLEIENSSLKIAPEALMISEFKILWTRDKSKTKDKALKELAYVYHTTNFKSIYRNYHAEMREGKIKVDLFGEEQWKPDARVVAAQEKYKELQTTLSIELLDDVEFGLTQLRNYFRNVSFSADDDDDGRAAKNFIANMKQLGDLVKGIKSLREEAEKELSNKMQLRGGAIISKRELPPERRG